MNRLLPSVLGCIACVLTASVADAQIVRIGGFGGVRVRAPFVSVDVLPYGGGTRVRAPFTAVDTRLYSSYRGYYGPGYDPRGYYAPRTSYYGAVPAVPAYRGTPGVVYPVPNRVSPTPAAPAADLPARLSQAAQQLSSSLARRRDDSDVWLDYLAPQRIVQSIDQGEPGSSLSDLLANYEGVIGNAELSSIWVERGFRETYRYLDQYVRGGAAPTEAAQRPGSAAAAVQQRSGQGNSILAPSAEAPTPAQPVRSAVDEEAGAEETPDAEEIPIPTPL